MAIRIMGTYVPRSDSSLAYTRRGALGPGPFWLERVVRRSAAVLWPVAAQTRTGRLLAKSALRLISPAAVKILLGLAGRAGFILPSAPANGSFSRERTTSAKSRPFPPVAVRASMSGWCRFRRHASWCHEPAT